MRVAIHQPNLIPRLKVLQKIALSDVWVVLDDVKFNRRDHQHRAWLVPTVARQPARWLTVPVRGDASSRSIREVVPSIEAIDRRLHDGLTGAFGTSPAVAIVAPALAAAHREEDFLSMTGIAVTRSLLDAAGLAAPEVVLASQLREAPEPKTDGLAQILECVGATHYLADSGAVDYLDPAPLQRLGIAIDWQVWRPEHMVGEPLSVMELRNGSALNVLARSQESFKHYVTTSRLSRNREEART